MALVVSSWIAKRQRQCHARRHRDRLALDGDLVRRIGERARCGAVASLDDVAQVGALPVAARELVVRLAERDQAALEGLAEIFGGMRSRALSASPATAPSPACS